MKRVFALGLIIAIFFEQAAPSWAAEEDAFQFFQEEAKVVSASRIPESRQKAAATTYVVTSADIKDSGAQTIPDAIRNVPGVDVMQTSTGQAEVSIRGLSSVSNNRTLVLLDGKTVLNSLFDFITWETIPVVMDEIDRIEIVEGPSSAVYGGNAVDGVINIITKTPEKMQGGKLSYNVGERSTQVGNFVYGKQSDRLGYRLGGDWDSTNQYADADQLASQAGKFDSLLKYRLSDQSDVSVSGGVTHSNTQKTIGATGTGYDEGITSFARADYRYADTRFKAFWNHGRTDFREYQFPPGTNLDYDTYDAEIEQSLSLPFNNETVLGASYRRNTTQSFILQPGLLSQDLWSAFLEDKWSMADHWSLVASGRVDRHPFTPIKLSPRGSLIYNPVEEHVFRLSAGSAFRDPTLTENYLNVVLPFPNPGTSVPNPPFTTLQSDTVGNRNLEPEKVESVEIAHNGNYGRLKTTLAMFHYQLADTIEGSDASVTSAVPPTLITQSSYINDPGVIKAWGGEAGMEWLAASWLTTFANYSYQYLHDDTALQIIPNESPRHKVNMGLKAKMGRFTGNLWSNWVDKTVWPTVLIQPGPNDVAAVSSYYLLNLHAGYAFAGSWDGLEIGITGTDILNHDHYEILPSQSASMPGQNGEIVKSRWTGTVSYKFL